MSNVLEQYIQQVSEEVKLDQFNIKEKQMRLPAIKHFWVARLVNSKIRLNKLKSQYKVAKHQMVQDIMAKAPTRITITAAAGAADAKLVTITDEIDELEAVVEYLEKVEKILGTMHWEVKNIVELQQMETL